MSLLAVNPMTGNGSCCLQALHVQAVQEALWEVQPYSVSSPLNKDTLSLCYSPTAEFHIIHLLSMSISELSTLGMQEALQLYACVTRHVNITASRLSRSGQQAEQLPEGTSEQAPLSER